MNSDKTPRRRIAETAAMGGIAGALLRAKSLRGASVGALAGGAAGALAQSIAERSARNSSDDEAGRINASTAISVPRGLATLSALGAIAKTPLWKRAGVKVPGLVGASPMSGIAGIKPPKVMSIIPVPRSSVKSIVVAAGKGAMRNASALAVRGAVAPGASGAARVYSPSDVVSGVVSGSKLGRAASFVGSSVAGRDNFIGRAAQESVARKILGAKGRRDFINKSRAAQAQRMRDLREETANSGPKLDPEWGSLDHIPEGSRDRVLKKLRHIQNLKHSGATEGERQAAMEAMIRVKKAHNLSARESLDSIIQFGGAWTRKEGKSKSGGLNEKGRKSYERENPGSDLKAPSKEAGNPRRASFCARMKGMKKKLTSSKTASDPDSRINKSLRAWNCSARESLDSIINFAGGYIRVEDDPDAIYKQPGIVGHLKRHAAKYISAPLAVPGLGIPLVIGAHVDSIRSESNMIKAMSEDPVKLKPGKKARISHRLMKSDNGQMALVPMSARDQLNIINFADPRPRNSLGMFSGAEAGADPEAIGAVYKQGGQMAQQEEGVLASLARKLKGKKIKMSAREELNTILFAKKGGDYKRHWSQIKKEDEKGKSKKKCKDCGETPCECHTYSARDQLSDIVSFGIRSSARKAWRGFWHGESAEMPAWADAMAEKVASHPLTKATGVDVSSIRDNALATARQKTAEMNRKILGWSVIPPAIQYGISKRDSNKSEKNIINAINQKKQANFSARDQLNSIVEFGESEKSIERERANIRGKFFKNGNWIDPRVTSVKGAQWEAVRRRINHGPDWGSDVPPIDNEAEFWGWDDKQKMAVEASDDFRRQIAATGSASRDKRFSSRDQLNTIMFARGDMLMKTMKRVGVSAPRAELGAIEAAGRGVQGAFNQAATAAGRSDLAGVNTVNTVRSHLAGQLNEARKVTRNAPFKKPVAERPVAPDSGLAPDPRLKTAASYGNTPVQQPTKSYEPSTMQPVNPAPQQGAVNQPATPQPKAMSGPSWKYRMRGWRGAAVAGAAGVGAGAGMGYAMRGSGASNV